MGAEVSGSDNCRGDAELLEFENERLCEAGDRKLGSGVRCPARSTEVATHRSDREQVPAALASHDWQHGASDVHHAVYVGCELLVDLFRRHFLKRSDETVARVVDEDIDSTKVMTGSETTLVAAAGSVTSREAVISRVQPRRESRMRRCWGSDACRISLDVLDPTTDTVISPTVALQRISARDKKRG